MIRGLLIGAVLLTVGAVDAGAQGPGVSSPSTPFRRIELGVGGGFEGALSLGERDAALRANSTTPNPYRLFSTDTRLDGAPLLEVRLGYRVSARLTAEGTLSMARPTLTSSLTSDVENAPAVEATAPVTEYVVTGGGLWRLSTDARRRWTPFVSGGGGVARHVHDGNTLIESGVDVYAGGGLIYALGRRAAARLDGRLHVLNGGLADGQGASPRGVLSGSVFVTF